MAQADEAFRILDRTLHAFGPDVTTDESGGFVKYHRGRAPHGAVFAIARPLKTRVDVAFRRYSRARSKRVLDAKAAGFPTLPYRVILEAPGDLDHELLSWLRESYEISEA